MAQKIEIRLVDDLDASAADETLSFALDGVAYEIDLSADNAAGLRNALANYIGHARRVGGRRRGADGRRRATGSDTAAIRAWAKDQGLAVSERGRIPAGIVDQYNAAH